MADSTTTKLGFTKPGVGDTAGANAWGGKLNNNFDLLDTLLAQRTSVNDADYTVVANDRLVCFTRLTAARKANLPAASAFPTGALLIIKDTSANAGNTNIIVTPNGSDTIEGAASYVIAIPRGFVALQSNGSNSWDMVSQFPSVQNGTGVSQMLYNIVKIGWTGANLRATVDTTDMGRMWVDAQTPFVPSASGYIKFVNGMIIQWGQLSASGDIGVTFPIAFPNGMFGAWATVAGNGGAGAAYPVTTDNYQNNTFAIRARQVSNGGGVNGLAGSTALFWFALGY